MKTYKILGLAAVIALVACGGSKGSGPKVPGSGKMSKGGGEVSKAAASKFESALAQMVSHDKKSNWNDGSCTAVAQQFLEAVDEQKKANKGFPEAHYNAGLAYQRCSKDKEAKGQFNAALGANSKFHRAKVQLALYEYKSKGDSVLDSTITRLHDAVIEAKFQNVDALVNLAMLQMKRNGPNSGTSCTNDMECAKMNVQRALAIDDGNMPAFNQLALYYLNQAKAKAETRKKRSRKRRLVAASGLREQLSVQMLDLAALVCSQAIRKNAKYAPIYNTLGLIDVELKKINSAVQAFNSARSLDPKFFEAQMNYAAVNLSFRGFDQAVDAYKQALKMRPKSFEAHLGLALALRGQINDSNWDKNIAGAQSSLNKCKKLAPQRPETYFNEAILVQEFKAKGAGGDTKTIKTYQKAMSILDTFMQKAGSSPEYKDAVKNATERKEDMTKMIQFIREGQKADAAVKKGGKKKKRKKKK